MPDEPLTPEERAALASVRREQVPPADLEDRTVDRLRAAGLLGRPRAARALWQAAAAVIVFALGVATGQVDLGVTPEPPGSRYLLLLHGAPSASDADEQARIEEYGRWAREVVAGRLLSAEKLTDRSEILGAPDWAPADAQQPAGFFLIRAASLDEARSIAATCPHLRHGGTVVVREIHETN